MTLSIKIAAIHLLHTANAMRVPGPVKNISEETLKLFSRNYLLGSRYQIPLGFSWSGVPYDFADIHAQLSNKGSESGCFNSNWLRTCFNETGRSMRIEFSFKAPAETSAVHINDVNNLGYKSLLRHHAESVAGNGKCSTDSLKAVKGIGSYFKVVYGQVFLEVEFNTQDYLNFSEPFIITHLTKRVPLKLSNGQCDIIFGVKDFD
ncbi:hypothetical protein DSO57_1019947 [Entomophthora muscae]|uniref:Uncharacterized protein n=1 Tax=Entomophthora muscae TaxID=34485 RepID=A0ACC2RV60_9FUNG|nr:hypothetical protein DSO57_1019947 [Entomophthora muscae]